MIQKPVSHGRFLFLFTEYNGETAPERAGMCPGAEASADVTEGLAVVPGCIRVWDELLSGE